MDAVSNLKKLEFVKAQLATYGGEKKHYGERVMIRCPFHNDNTPSGSLSLSLRFPGTFKCYACGKKASWDELATNLSLQPYKRLPPREEYAANLLIHEPSSNLVDSYRKDRFKFYEIPSNKVWRSISTNLIISLGGKLSIKWNSEYESWGSEKFIYFPIYIQQELRGFFRARLKKRTGNPSYLNAAGKWSVNYGLFPFDHAISLMKKLRSTTIILVEGPRDALRLISENIPAMCIFGTQSWSDSKARLLEISGVKDILLMMDGDSAGYTSSIKIYDNLKDTQMFDTIKRINLCSIKGSPYIQFKDEKDPSKAAKQEGVSLWDPASIPNWLIDKIRLKYFGE